MGKKTLRGLIDVIGTEKLQIVAGEGGIDREIKWTSTVEDIDLIAFSGKGYLNFVTGHKMLDENMNTDEKKVADIVASSYFHGLAGVVFAPGEESGAYMESIPQRVIDFANEHDFPLFTIHWSTKISDMTKYIGEYILLEDALPRTAMEILKDVCAGGITLPLRDEDQKILERNLFYESTEYTAVYLSILGNTMDLDEKVKDSVLSRVNSHFGAFGTVIPLEADFLAIFKDDAGRMLKYENLLKEADELESYLGDGFYVRIGAGTCLKGYEGLAESFRQARLTAGLDDDGFYTGKRILFYADAGMYKELWNTPSRKELIKFSNETLSELIKYDELNDTDLFRCLEIYIKCGCNAKLTSEIMYVHKNTVAYKLKKIESILGGELSNRRMLFDLQFAIIVRYAYL